MLAIHYDHSPSTPAQLDDLLDAAEQGHVATIRREAFTAAFVDGEQLRRFVTSLIPSRVEAALEPEGWSVFIPDLPLAVEGGTFEEAISEMLEVLRDYANDWQERLLNAPNHRENWGLVQLISMSDDQQLREWLIGS